MPDDKTKSTDGGGVYLTKKPDPDFPCTDLAYGKWLKETGLAPARGCFFGVLLGLLFWVGVWLLAKALL